MTEIKILKAIFMFKVSDIKKIIFIGCALCILLSGGISFADLNYCSPPKLTPEESNLYLPKDNEVIQKYIHIWKKLFKAKNNLDDTKFDKHIYVFWAYGIDGKAPEFLNIHYYVNIDWFYALERSQLLVMLSSSDDAYRYLNINRDVYLSEDEIKLLLERAHYQGIKTVNVRQPLFFPSMKDALNKLNETAKENIFREHVFSTGKTICTVSSNGDPLIQVRGVLNYDNNECLNGEVNLRTGEIKVSKTVCIIN